MNFERFVPVQYKRYLIRERVRGVRKISTQDLSNEQVELVKETLKDMVIFSNSSTNS